MCSRKEVSGIAYQYKKEDCNCRYSDIGYPDKAESCIPRMGNRQRIKVCRLHSRFNLHRRGRCDALRNPAERNYDFSASDLAVTPSEIEQYGKVTVKFRLDSWDRNLPYEDNINGRQHIQSGKYFRSQRRRAGTKNHGGSCGRGCRGIAGRCAFRFGIHFIETQKAVLTQPAQPYKQ